MFKATIDAQRLEKPTLVYTKAGNPAAEGVIQAISKLPDWEGVRTVIFQDDAEITTTFCNGYHPSRALVLWDGAPKGFFTFAASGRMHGPKMPAWAQGTQWGTCLNHRTMTEKDPDTGADRTVRRRQHCAEMLRAHFNRRFHSQLEEAQQFPWGALKKGETLPNRPRLRAEIYTILENLRQGPDMADEVFEAVRGRLPQGEKISWIRVPDRPAEVDRAMMECCLDAISAFERASSAALAACPAIAEQLMLGVTLDRSHSELRDYYLFPRANDVPLTHWSVRRPDMHICGKQLIASENDEMPGGFTDCFHIDRSYGVNQEVWMRVLNWLCAQGPLLFLVSDNWSRPYIKSMQWMAYQMVALGYEAYCLTSSELDAISITDEGVFCAIGDRSVRIGTIWRQFPIFETRGKLADLVMAAHHNCVRMVPEFAHFGNKSWFALFHEHMDALRPHLTDAQAKTLQMLIPRSRLIDPRKPFAPIRLLDKGIHSYSDLVRLDAAGREQLVLKVTGANNLAARSYGVLMGHAQPEGNWREWLAARASLGQPFIVQRRFETSVEHIAVWNTTTRSAEPFACRVLLRPWQVAEELVTTHTACTPHTTTKVHGMLDMAVQPVVYV